MFKGLSLSEVNDLVTLGGHVPHEIPWVLGLMRLMKRASQLSQAYTAWRL